MIDQKMSFRKKYKLLLCTTPLLGLKFPAQLRITRLSPPVGTSSPTILLGFFFTQVTSDIKRTKSWSCWNAVLRFPPKIQITLGLISTADPPFNISVFLNLELIVVLITDQPSFAESYISTRLLMQSNQLSPQQLKMYLFLKVHTVGLTTPTCRFPAVVQTFFLTLYLSTVVRAFEVLFVPPIRYTKLFRNTMPCLFLGLGRDILFLRLFQSNLNCQNSVSQVVLLVVVLLM